MTNTPSSNLEFETESDRIADLKGLINQRFTGELSEEAQELLGVLEAMGDSFGHIELRETLGWDVETYDSVTAELLAIGNRIPLPQQDIDTGLRDHLSTCRQVADTDAPLNNEQQPTDEVSENCFDTSFSSHVEQNSFLDSLSDLEDFLCKAAQIGSPSYDEDEKERLLGILFIKLASDIFEDARQSVVRHHIMNGKNQSFSEELAEDITLYKGTLFVPKFARWSHITAHHQSYRQTLYEACQELEIYHPSIKGTLTSITLFSPVFADNTDSTLEALINEFSSLSFHDESATPRLFMGACYFLEKFYDDHVERSEIERSASSYFRSLPRGYSKLLISLLNLKQGMSVYFQNCGLGEPLIDTYKLMGKQGGNPSSLRLVGNQSHSRLTWAMCKLNLLLNRIVNADIRSHGIYSDKSESNVNRNDRVVSIHIEKGKGLSALQPIASLLNHDGKIVALIPRSRLATGLSREDCEVRKQLNDSDSIEAVISLPQSSACLTDYDAIVVINLSKQKERQNKILFIDAAHPSNQQDFSSVLNAVNSSEIISCFETFSEVEDYSRIMAIDEVARCSYSLEVNHYVDASPEALQVKRLTKQYKGYSLVPLHELVQSAKMVDLDSACADSKNTVYLHDTFAACSLSQISKEPPCTQYILHAFEIVLDTTRISAGYLVLFLRSELGSLMLEKLLKRELYWTSDSLRCLMIPLPELHIQLGMAEARERLEVLKVNINQLEEELVFSPPSASAVLEQVDGMLDAVGSLTDADRLMSIIRQGESKSVEFKESFSLDLRKDTSERYIELSSLKTIVAFLNSDGGFLIVGVGDDGSTVGLEPEIQRFHNGSKDKFLLHFKNNLKSRIGEEYYPYINHRLVIVKGLPLLLVECKKSASGCFLDGKEFYVRTNPSTDKLEGVKLISYIKNHFSQ